MLSRCLYGAQLSVIIGFCAAALATVISILIGIVSGYLGGKFDLVMQRFVDAWMSFPDLIILIVVVSVVGPGHAADHRPAGPALRHRRLAHHPRRRALGAREHVRPCRAIDRRPTLPHPVEAHPAQRHAAGDRAVHHARRRGDPGRIRPVVPRPGRAAAGADLGRHAVGLRPHLHVPGPWLALAPGLCITIVVYAINVFGDALRDLLDPRMRGSR